MDALPGFVCFVWPVYLSRFSVATQARALEVRTPNTIVDNSQQLFADNIVCGLVVLRGASWGSSGANNKVECRNGPVSPPFVYRTNDVSDYPQYCCTARVGKRGRAAFLSLPLITSHAAVWVFYADKETCAVVAAAPLILRAYSWERVGFIGFWWLGHGHRTYRNSNGVSGGVKLDNQQAKRCKTLGALGHGRSHVQ